MRSTVPRPFLLMLDQRVIAEGTEWTDGSASMRWSGEIPVTSFWETGVDAIVAFHRTQGADAKIHYVDHLVGVG